MDPIRSLSLASLPVILPGAGSSGESVPVLPRPADVPAVLRHDDSPSFDLEKARYEAIIKAAQEIANRYVLGDSRFTIFKDVTGQYITRFTNLRDGKVTYIPEPELVRRVPAQPTVTLDI